MTILTKKNPLRGWLDSLQLQASHRTLGDRRPLLQVLEDQLASRSPHLLDSVRLGVVRQPASVGDSLHHLAALSFFCKEEEQNGWFTLLQQMTRL